VVNCGKLDNRLHFLHHTLARHKSAFSTPFCRSFMGQLRFRISNAQDYDPHIWQTAYFSGLEGIPWSSRNRLDGDTLIVDRSVNESGKLSIVWPTQEYGPLLVSTASLRCQEQPYILPLELARGTIHRIRGRALDWQRIGSKDSGYVHANDGSSGGLFCQVHPGGESDLEECCELVSGIDRPGPLPHRSRWGERLYLSPCKLGINRSGNSAHCSGVKLVPYAGLGGPYQCTRSSFEHRAAFHGDRAA
jgi:hypothetical protein